MPYYTQPREIKGLQVPDVLLSGHHSKITDWKKEQQVEITKSKRPDIWKKYINNKSLIIKSSHPSPLSAHVSFFGSKPFSATNTYLKEKGRKPINWLIK